MSRDAARTRVRILTAATAEFSEKGFAGARVDEIAARADVNKRLLYYHFGGKDELFAAVLARQLVEKATEVAVTPEDLGDSLEYWLQHALSNPTWMRLLQWEAVQGDSYPVVGEADRRRHYETAADGLREAQAAGSLDGSLDPSVALLAMIALTQFPVAFPQLTYLITGHPVNTDHFRERYTQFLHFLAARLADRTGTDQEPTRTPGKETAP